ncbi:DEAD/DEAH box helicase, partial [bacterium]|nr:DEAD/DEAH box helicase [bacterium]
MDVDGFLESLRRDPNYADQIVHAHTEPAREPVWAPLPEGLHPDVQKFLSAQGVSRVYQHQAEAIAASLRGEDGILTTGPASGKSLCYQVPILQSMLCEAETTALLLFPMKALARDQMGAWNRGVAAIPTLAKRKDVRAAAFDADASGADKRAARGSARLLATNPEMLHVRLLPAHGRWGRFYQGLRYIVIDEIHTYAGFFGANMANVLRRLARVCEHYGSRPQFICSSATVGNPVDVAQRVTGRTLHHVGRDTSASGARTYVFWNPPRIKKGAWRARRSANVEAHDLMVQLVKQRVPTLCFSKSRTSAELVYRYVRETLQTEAPVLADRVAAYRGGYSPAERRDMERRLREGELLGVSCTRALELGIDVGALDACIVVGYPGWLHAFYQQMGRAGRCGRASLCVLVGTGTVINQYVMQHPEYVFERPMERAVVDCDNPFVVLGHVRCATAELPLHDAETAAFGYCADLALDVLEEKHKVFHGADAWYHASPDPPAHEVRLRGYGDESTVIMDVESKEVLDRLDKFRAVRIFYPGAVYFHRGDTWLMVHHDFERNVVWVRREDVPYYTDPISGTCVNHVDRVLDQRPLGTGTAHLGEVFAVLSTFVYERVRFYSLERLSQHPADVPDFSYEAMSFWLTTPPELPLQVAKIGLNPEDGMRGIL